MLEQLKQKFKEEVYELLDKLETILLELEKNMTNTEIIQEVFRIMHTIKGAAGMYEFHTTVELTHKLENIYALIRDKKAVLSTKIVSLTFDSIDFIRKLVASDDSTNQAQNFTDFVERIDELNNKLNIQFDKKNNQKNDDYDDDIIDLFDDFDDEDEEEIIENSTYYILFQPEANISERGINLSTIIEEVKDFTDEVKVFEHSLPQDKMLKNQFYLFWEFIITTEKPETEIEDIFLFVEDETKIVKLSNINLFGEDVFNTYLSENYLPLEAFDLQKIQEISQTLSGEENISQPDEKINLEESETEFKAHKENMTEIILEQETIISRQKTKSIKVSSDRLDELMYLVSELIISNAEINLIAQETKNNRLQKAAEKLNKISQNLKRNALSTRLIPIKQIMFRFERLVRDLSAELNKKVNFVVEGAETELDKNIVDSLSIPIMHLIRNAIDHGIESSAVRKKLEKSEIGIVRFTAFNAGSNVVIQIRDDGSGIDPEIIFKKAVEKKLNSKTDKLTLKEIYNLLFLPGFSTAQKITGISGRGIGMDAIQQAILNLRGDIEIDSEINLGTSITIKLPLTLSIIETMQVSIGDTKFLIPTSNIQSCSKHDHNVLMKYHNQRLIADGKLIPFIYLRKKFEFTGEALKNERIVFVKHNDKIVALVFDRIVDEHQAVIKPLGNMFLKQDFISGGSILADGTVALILDVYKLIKQFVD